MLIHNNNKSTLHNEIITKIKNDEVLILIDSFTLSSLNFLNDLASNNSKLKILLSRNLVNGINNHFERKFHDNKDDSYVYELEYIAGVSEFLGNIKSGKIELKSMDKNQNEYSAVIGSQVAYYTPTELSLEKLGLRFSKNNYAINVVESDDLEALREYSMEIYSSSIDYSEKFSEKINFLSMASRLEIIYYNILKDVFDSLENNYDEQDVILNKTGFYESKIWSLLYDFQKDAVKSAINKINKFNGCIIADSVGLGKTFEAIAVINYFQKLNMRVLVLTPKKLNENWTMYKANYVNNPLAEDRLDYDVLNHTDLTRNTGKSGELDLERINWGNYGLVVIDESHNFRNKNYHEEKETRYSKLMNHIIKSGVQTKVLLLSATPINNGLTDLKNQLDIITEENDVHLANQNISSISDTLRKAQAAINKWSKADIGKTTKELLRLLDFEYFTLLSALTIARSRKHIVKYYDMNAIGAFPKRLAPVNKNVAISKDNSINIEQISNRMLALDYALYTPTAYILPEFRKLYSEEKGLSMEGREKGLTTLMRVNLLKRMESSVHSFNLTIQGIIEKVEAAQASLELQEQVDFLEVEDEEIDSEILTRVDYAHVDKLKFNLHLESDLQKLNAIYELTKNVTVEEDNKLQELLKMIDDKVTNPINIENRKILIFSAFADTATYIYEAINEVVKRKYGLNTALVTGSDKPRHTTDLHAMELNDILTCFSPVSKNRKAIERLSETTIDIVVATDCISEGQNLQDCDCVINYDIHWNPVRVIQRFGRVDRIGSVNKVIQMINFWPDLEIERYIKLEQKIKDKATIGNLSVAGDNIFEEEDKELEYRAKQILKMQSEILDLEDIEGTVSLTDFNLDEFKVDAQKLSQKHKGKTFQKGMYSVVKSNVIPSGIIACFNDKMNNFSENKKNPIYPFSLIHVSKSGEVISNMQETKDILDKIKLLDNTAEKRELNSIDKRMLTTYKSLMRNCLDECKEITNSNEVNDILTGKFSVKKLQTKSDDYVLHSFIIIEEE